MIESHLQESLALLTRLMKLDLSADKVTASGVEVVGFRVKQLDREHVSGSGLVIVGHNDTIGQATQAVDVCGAVNFASGGIDDAVVPHASAVHLRTIGAMIDVLQMAPKATVVLDSATNSKVAFVS